MGQVQWVRFGGKLFRKIAKASATIQFPTWLPCNPVLHTCTELKPKIQMTDPLMLETNP